MGADDSFYVKSIATCAPTFFGYFWVLASVSWQYTLINFLADKTDNENGTEEGGDQASGTEKVSQEFTEKTDLLLEYIERTYLADGYVSFLSKSVRI